MQVNGYFIFIKGYFIFRIYLKFQLGEHKRFIFLIKVQSFLRKDGFLEDITSSKLIIFLFRRGRLYFL